MLGGTQFADETVALDQRVNTGPEIADEQRIRRATAGLLRAAGR